MGYSKASQLIIDNYYLKPKKKILNINRQSSDLVIYRFSYIIKRVVNE